MICNQQYIDMFGLSPDVVKPGCHLRELIRHRQQLGSFVGDVDAYCARFLDPNGSLVQDTVISTPDGRTIRLIYKRSPDGGWATTLEDVTERRRVQARIEHLAHYDALTNLPNRTLFQRHAEGLLLETEGREFAILYIDIDEFKRINDSLGHLIGDEFLKGVAERLRQSVGPEDFIARLGGDEFAILQHGIASTEDVHALVARIYQALRTPFDCHGHQPFQRRQHRHRGRAARRLGPVRSAEERRSRDVCGEGGRPQDLSLLRSRDGAAGQSSPRAGGGFARGAGARAASNCTISRRSICAATRVTGCEALLRWRHPVRGMVSPADFMPVAEETGLIEEIGQWVLRTACAEAATWPADVRIAVNVSPIQFRSETLSLKVAAALAESRARSAPAGAGDHRSRPDRGRRRGAGRR